MIYSTFDDLKIGAHIGRGVQGEGPRGVFDVVGEREEGRDGGPVWLDPRPSWKPNDGEGRPDDEKYMAYLPHSGCVAIPLGPLPSMRRLFSFTLPRPFLVSLPSSCLTQFYIIHVIL
jgi:hypothetical protein